KEKGGLRAALKIIISSAKITAAAASAVQIDALRLKVALDSFGVFALHQASGDFLHHRIVQALILPKLVHHLTDFTGIATFQYGQHFIGRHIGVVATRTLYRHPTDQARQVGAATVRADMPGCARGIVILIGFIEYRNPSFARIAAIIVSWHNPPQVHNSPNYTKAMLHAQ